MAFLSVRVPQSLKEKMKKINGVNWSEVVRGAIEERVEEELRRKRQRDPAEILEAIGEQDRIARVLGSKPTPDWSGVEVIRYWREHRYSSSTPR